MAFTDGHPVARWNHSARRFQQAWGLGRAACFTAGGRFGRILMVFGDHEDAERLTSTALTVVNTGDDVALDMVVVPRGAAGPGRERFVPRHEWEWFWTTEVPAHRPGEAAVEQLDTDDVAVADELTELLRASSPATSALPGDPTVDSWYGVRDTAGALVACAAESERSSEVPNLRAIAVRPDLRGRGVGADVTARVMRVGFDAGAPAVTLGMYSDNDTARGMYERLGFRMGQAFTTWIARA
ncbi:GNAT family N-acetyltransferase [Haloactinopolyspora alba]|uniref:GNAT family N-acetyltransferase n=1 Tax=Haloactinopolyspora alba TaxID=648780 RepID=UPI00101BF843|nr:GNAT family N-acetyltransferase [Haloactinopolyspora alba]